MRSKYRIWDKQENKWFEPIYKGYEGQIFDLVLNPRSDLIAHCEGITIGGYSGLVHESCFSNRFEVQFSTGIKDKNGKEIYDKDIVEYIEGGIYEVYQHDSGAWMAGDNVIWEEIDEVKYNPYKVIGNVYDNPEALSDCKYFNNNICMFDNTKCYLKYLHNEGLFFDCNKFI